MHITDQRLHTPWQHKAFTKLLGLQYRIAYRKGPHNAAADALSRKYEDNDNACLALSECTPTWLDAVVQGYYSDEYSKQLLTEVSLDPNARNQFQLSQGVMKFKGRIWVGNNTSIQQQLLNNLHSSPMGGHSGFPVTYQRVKALFAWPHMKKMIYQWVHNCTICQ